MRPAERLQRSIKAKCPHIFRRGRTRSADDCLSHIPGHINPLHIMFIDKYYTARCRPRRNACKSLYGIGGGWVFACRLVWGVVSAVLAKTCASLRHPSIQPLLLRSHRKRIARRFSFITETDSNRKRDEGCRQAAVAADKRGGGGCVAGWFGAGCRRLSVVAREIAIRSC